MPCDQLRELQLQQERDRKRDEEKKKQRQKSLETVKGQAKTLGWTLIWNMTDQWKFDAVKPNGDKIHFEILESGIIKTMTDKISMVNHMNAEQFLLNIARDLGGKWNIRHKHGGEVHEHTHSESA